jgi:hypothetical protein
MSSTIVRDEQVLWSGDVLEKEYGKARNTYIAIPDAAVGAGGRSVSGASPWHPQCLEID